MRISVIVLTHNSAVTIQDCLHSVREIAEEIIVIDDLSTDKTTAIAEKFSARIYPRKLVSFAQQRNYAVKLAQCPWVLIIDSDEIATPELIREIKAVRSNHSAYRMRRRNYFFGRPVKHGGWWPDWQTRLFKVKNFSGYSGDIHETPQFQGSLGSFAAHLLHYSHNNLKEGLEKSIKWTKTEAVEFIKSGHPPITWWQIIKVTVWEFSYRYFKKLGLLDGYVGLIESIIQAINRFFVYQQIWELQQKK